MREINLLSSAYYIDFVPDIDLELTVLADGPYDGDVGETLEFTGDAYLGNEPFYWSWDFGDGETSSERNTTHVYDAPGEYTVTLEVTDGLGAISSDSFSISITSGGDTNGGDDNNGLFDSNILMFGAVIVIIAIIGVIALIFVIRR